MEEILENLSKTGAQIVANPETIEYLKKLGLIREKFVPHKVYVHELYESRRRNAVQRLDSLPQLEKTIADSTATSIYEEIRESVAFGIPTASIFNSIMLLEYALRTKLYKRLLQEDPNTKWEMLEGKVLGKLIRDLGKKGVLSDEEKKELIEFNYTFRNPYLHFNIWRLVKDMTLSKLPKFHIDTKRLEEMENVEAGDHRFLWFSAKKAFDKHCEGFVIDFSLAWTNKLLAE